MNLNSKLNLLRFPFIQTINFLMGSILDEKELYVKLELLYNGYQIAIVSFFD